MKVFDAQGRQRLSLFAADFKRCFAGRDSARLFLDGFDVPGVLEGRDPLNKSLFVWAKSFLPNYILNLLGDRMEMGTRSKDGCRSSITTSSISSAAWRCR